MTTGDIAVGNLVAFIRSLRDAGFAVTPSTTRDLTEAARIVGMHDGRDVRAAFGAVVVARHGQLPRFNEIFDQFFSGEVSYLIGGMVDESGPSNEEIRSFRIPIASVPQPDVDDDAVTHPSMVGGSYTERLMDVDFADLSPEDAAAMSALLASMVWSPLPYRSRRWMAAHAGPVPDMRRTLRAMAGPKGDLVPLSFSRPRPKQRPLIVLADISGSMERYAEMLLHFVHGAQHRFASVESFVFATRLTRITRQLRRRNASDALSAVSGVVRDWSGGTRIGEAVGAYNKEWARRVGTSGSTVLIISDGWETGDPSVLMMEMRRLARSVHRVIWLNPLAGREGFAPEARGMAAALPFVDELVAGGTARNLIELVDLLQSDRSDRRSVGVT